MPRSRSNSSSSSSSDEEDNGKCQKKSQNIINIKFGSSVSPLLSFFTFGSFVGNNLGNFRIELYPKKSLTRYIVQPYFYNSASGNGILDHVKFTQFLQPIAIPNKGALQFKVRIGGTIVQPAILPSFISQPNDPRTGSFGLVLLTNDFVAMNLLVTNNKIYAFYERLPFGWSATTTYSSFSAAHFVKSRTPTDIHDLELTFDKKNNKLIYVVDGIKVEIDHPGLQPHKIYEDGKSYNNNFFIVLERNPPRPTNLRTDRVNPTSATLGFGTFTTMDMGDYDVAISSNTVSPGYIRLQDNYIRPTSFLFNKSLPVPPGSKPLNSNDPQITTVYGQGAIIDVYKLLVNSIKCK